MKPTADLSRELTAIYRAAIAAVDPALLVRRALAGSQPDSSEVSRAIERARRILVLAIGKASYAMAVELELGLGSRIAHGLAVIPPAPHPPAALARIRLMQGGHPLPNESSVDAATAALQVLEKAGEDDLVVVGLSGGASAMFAAPASGLTLDDKITVTSALLRSGATIRELNCVRKHLSAVKGGRLLNSISGDVPVVALILSDVPGDDLATIGSGLTAPDPSTFADAISILKRRRIWGRAPERVRDYLERGVAGEIADTPKSDSPAFHRVTNLIVGSNKTALDAAAAEAHRLGFSIQRSRELKGEADDLGRDLALAMTNLETTNTCVLAGGEPSVTVRGNGRGGRAQQCALAMALELSHAAPAPRVAALIAGTDGVDGPTDAAGAFVFPDTVARMQAAEVSPQTALKRNDAYNAFDAIGDLFRTGPTGTNVTDLLIGLVNF